MAGVSCVLGDVTAPPAALIRADSISLPLADDSVDLIITSPPYFALRSYTDGGEHYDGQIGSEPTPQDFLAALWAVTAECRRVLKPSGSLWVNLGDKYNSAASGQNGTGSTTLSGGEHDVMNGRGSTVSTMRPKSLMGLPWRYAIGCIDDLDLILRAEVVWSKPNGLPESVTDRVRRSHEQWFMFTKEPRYFAAVDEVREPHSGGSNYGRKDGGNGPVHEKMVANGDRGGVLGSTNPDLFNPLGKLPGSVSGICVECGEGRRPVVAKELGPMVGSGHTRVAATNGARTIARESVDGARPSGRKVGTETATITGYACACDTPNAPTRPAVVLDPFGGTGTVAMVARALGRYPVHVDLSADYLRLARWRIFDSGHASKSRERTNREAQQTMFGAAS